jgi:tetratricopeptide (TPR) repeat protein
VAVWTDKCDEQCSNVFELQDAIAEHIAGALALQLTGNERKQLAKHYTENTEAYQLFNMAMYHFRQFTKPGFEKSIEYLEQAIATDPNYALAYVRLAGAYASFGQRGFWLPQASRQQYERAAQKAVELDDTLAEAHAMLGYVKKNNWDWADAEKELQRALELDPNAFDVNFLYYAFLRDARRPNEALPFAKRTEELGGLNPEPSVAVVYFHMRQYDKASELFQKAIEKNPRAPFPHLRLGQIYLVQGRYAESIAELQKGVALNNAAEEWNAYPVLAYAYALAGQRDEALKILDHYQELAKHQYISPCNFAIIHAGLGDKDHAFEYLNKAYEERAQSLIQLVSAHSLTACAQTRASQTCSGP